MEEKMNDRIETLAKAAGYDSITKDYMKALGFNLETFAELIVRECAKIADSADESACEWIGGNILTHFGVEE
jgi:hypothetical protein